MTMHPTLTYRPSAAKASGWLRPLSVLIALAMLFPMWVGIRTVWGLSTMRYELTSTALIIPYGPLTTYISRSEITGVQVLTPTGGIRRWGTGMPGLQEGHWSFKETGPIYMYSTTTHPLTVVETAHGKWGLSPADSAAFVSALKTGATGVWEPASAARGAGPALLLFVSLVMPFGVVVLMIYLMRVHRTIAYTLGDEALEIRIGWSRICVPYTGILAAEAASPPGTPWKTWGAYMPGLYWGAFAWRGTGPNLRLYATQVKPVVLIKTRTYTYGINPDDADGFVAELLRRVPRDPLLV